MKKILLLTLSLGFFAGSVLAQEAQPPCCEEGKPAAEATENSSTPESGPCPMEGGECEKFGTAECQIRGGECDDMKDDCPFEGDDAKAPCADCEDPGKCEDAAKCANGEMPGCDKMAKGGCSSMAEGGCSSMAKGGCSSMAKGGCSSMAKGGCSSMAKGGCSSMAKGGCSSMSKGMPMMDFHRMMMFGGGDMPRSEAQVMVKVMTMDEDGNMVEMGGDDLDLEGLGIDIDLENLGGAEFAWTEGSHMMMQGSSQFTEMEERISRLEEQLNRIEALLNQIANN